MKDSFKLILCGTSLVFSGMVLDLGFNDSMGILIGFLGVSITILSLLVQDAEIRRDRKVKK